MKTTLIHPTTFKLDGGAMFGIIPKPLWEKKIKADSFNRISMSLRVVLFETENRKILVDTGIGDYHHEKFMQQFDIQPHSAPLVNALKSLSIDADQITDIVITHLHFDHVGGLGGGRDGKDLIFKNATIHVHKNHFEYAQNPTMRDAGSFHQQTFMPLLEQYKQKKQLRLVEGDKGTLIKDSEEEINFLISFGHTPYMLHPYNSEFIYMADLVPMQHHLNIPWVMGYDIEPGTTTIYKKMFYDFIYKNNLCMIFEHDNETWGGKVSFDEKGKPHLIEVGESTKTLTQRL